MRTVIRIFAAVAAVLMLYGLAAVGLNAIFNRTGRLEKEYRTELEIEKYYDISAEDAARVLTHMMRYSTGREDELESVTITEDGRDVPFFNETELSHMRDVRKLARTILWSGAICLIVSLVTLYLLFIFDQTDELKIFAKAYLIALAAAVAIIIALAIWVAVDFDGFWTVFHRVFFAKQGNWTFDPAVSRMIRICPAELFADFVGRLGSYAAILTGAVGIVCVLCLMRAKRKKAQ